MITLEQLDNRLSQSTDIIYDSETDGLDWRVNKIVGHVFTFSADPRDSWYFPVRHEGKNPYDAKKTAQVIRHHSHRTDLRWTMHNASFDLAMMRTEDIDPWGKIEDTSVNEALLDEYAPSYSLDACARRRKVTEKKGEDLYKHLAALFGGEPTRNQMGNFWKLAADDPMTIDYATGDGTSTWELRDAQRILLQAEELERVWSVECRLIPVLHQASMKGIKVHEERMHKVIKLLENTYEKARTGLPKDLNERSPLQMRSYFTGLGFTNWPLTAPSKKFPQGNPSFTKEWLLTNPPGQQMVAVREMAHMLNSFLYPLRDRHLYKGRVHTDFHQTRDDEYGTVTGRLSSSEPNMQQAHKRNESLGPLLRSLFIPDDDHEWDSNDLKQCEPRLLAQYSKARVLVEGYLSDPPVDAHTAVARAAGIDRESGKRLNQAIITGAGRKKIIRMIGKGDDFGNRVYDDYFRAMPEVRQIQKDMASVMENRGYIKTILGRRCRMRPGRMDLSYQALNRALQGSNADIIKLAMVRIAEEIGPVPGFDVLINVHDALEFQVMKTPEAQAALAEARRIFCDYGPGRSIEMRIPQDVDYKSGPDWAVATWGREVVEKAFKDKGSNYRRM